MDGESTTPRPPRGESLLDRSVDGARLFARDGLHTALGASLLAVNRLQGRRRDLRRWLETADAVEITARLRSEIDAVDQRIRRIEDAGDHLLESLAGALPGAAAMIVEQAREVAKDQSAQCRALLGREV